MPRQPNSSQSKIRKPRPKSLAPRKLVLSLLAWFATAARDLPWRRTLDPYAIWVSEIMLQQTQVKTVIPYWERWMRELPDVVALAAAPEHWLLKLWEGLGYYTRVRNLQKAAQHVVATHDGRFPRDFDAILALPGVGRYTAGAISSIAFNAPAPILDGNVIRVLTRLFAIGANPRDTATNAHLWELAARLVETAADSQLATLNPQFLLSGPCSVLNQSLMELGATICTPQNPQCAVCPVRSHCIARRDGRVDELPNLSPRTAATSREFHAFVVEHREEYLVRQRPARAVNAGLWEFPNLEVTGQNNSPAASLKQLLQATARCEPLCEIKHTITRYRITQRAFHVAMKRKPASTGDLSRWLPLAELHMLPFTGAHKRILARIPPLNAGKSSSRSSS